MRVVHISTYDVAGGAAIAAYRIHRCLKGAGVDSLMVVREKHSSDETVIGPSPAERGIAQRGIDFLMSLFLKWRYRPAAPFSVNMRGDARLVSSVVGLAPDLVHLHWVANQCLVPESLGVFGRPLVWTFHDMWPATGGCHYSGNCRKYQEQCGACPVLRSKNEADISRREFLRKLKSLAEVEIVTVSPSTWGAEIADESALFRRRPRHVIPHPLDLGRFAPRPREECRKRLGLSPASKVIMFCGAAAERRKGAHLIRPCAEALSKEIKNGDVLFLLVGDTGAMAGNGLPFPVKSIGTISDEDLLSACYCASDMTLVPSLEDILCNVVVESMACGTPCVAFRVGGIPDFVEHMVNGYLAEPFSVADLARGLRMLIESEELRGEFSARSRAQVEKKCGQEIVAQRYTRLYEEAMKGRRRG